MQKDNLSKKELKRSLNYSIKDSIYTNAMVGITDTYTTPFALALGANNNEIGLLNSIPKFFATIVQPLAGKYIEKVGVRKKISNTLTLVARLFWIPIIILPFIFSSEKVILLIILLSISQLASGIASTAWTSWMADLVPEKIRGKYFGRRSMMGNAAALATTLIGGWFLGFFDSLLGFSIIFFIALLLGLFSYYYLQKIQEPTYVKEQHKGHKIALHTVSFLKEYRKYRNFSTFTIYMSLMVFAVMIASPFFIVYMLNVINIGYEWYAIATAASIIMTVIMQPYWGRLADRYGDRTIMAICGMIIIFYPFFFLFVRTPIDVVIISLFSGFAWSGFDLTSFNYLLDITPPYRRSIYIGNFKLLTGFATFLGPLAGAAIVNFFADKILLFWSGIQTIFFISFILRAVSTFLLLPRMGEARVKATQVLPVRYVFWQAVAVYPIRGVIHELDYVQHCVSCWERKVGKKVKNWVG